MRLRLRHVVVAAAAVAPLATAPAAEAAPAAGDPMQTPPDFRGVVPTSDTVLGFPLGSREVSAANINEYVDAVDAASDRGVSGTFGTTPQGKEMRYALVG